MILSTESKAQDTRKSTSDGLLPNGSEEVRVLGDKEGRNAAIILLVMSFLIIGGLLLAIQYDMADPWVPDMVLYNHTGGEITIYLGAEGIIVQKDSSGVVGQPVTRAAWKAYKPLSISTVRKKWSYEVVYPPHRYKKVWSSSRKEYHYQIEANGA